MHEYNYYGPYDGLNGKTPMMLNDEKLLNIPIPTLNLPHSNIIVVNNNL
jgi:hypothetical protein